MVRQDGVVRVQDGCVPVWRGFHGEVWQVAVWFSGVRQARIWCGFLGTAGCGRVWQGEDWCGFHGMAGSGRVR